MSMVAIRFWVGTHRRGLWVMIGLVMFIAWFGSQAWFRHANFFTSQYDLGNMDNTLWHVMHGQGFVMTDPTKVIQVPRTAFHTDFLMLALVPVYALWTDPRLLIFVQVLVVASGVIPIYWLARKLLTPAWGVGFAWLYLLYPALHWAVMFDFHSITLAIASLLWAFWAIQSKRFWLFGITATIALLAKEEVGFIVGLLGVYLLVTRQKRWISLATIAAGFSWSAAMLGWVIPAARIEGQHFAAGWYSDFGDTPGTVLQGILSRPVDVLKTFLRLESLQYFGMLLWPLGFISLLGLPLLAVALPEIGINLLSSNPNLRAVYYHYTSAIIPFVFLSAIVGLAWFKRRSKVWLRVQPWLIGWLVISWLIAGWIWAPLPGLQFHREALRVFQTSPYRSAVAAAKSQVAPTANVAVTNNLAPHFTQRDWAWAFPYSLDRADVAIVLLGSEFKTASSAELELAVQSLIADPAWVLKIHQGQFYYFERIRNLAVHP